MSQNQKVEIFLILFAVLFPAVSSVCAQESATASGAGVSTGTAGANSTVVDLPPADWGENFQIGVFGGDPTTRAVFLSFCRDVQEDFRNTLFKNRPGEASRRLPWAVPVKVELWGDQTEVFHGDYLRTNVLIGPDNRLLIRVRVKLHDRFEQDAFRLELIRALLREQIVAPYVSSPGQLEGAEIRAPEWLVHGFDQLLAHRRDGRPSAIYKGILTSGQMLKPGELFSVKSADKFDPVRYEAFRASASAMVEALLKQPDGDVALRSVLGEMGRLKSSSIEPTLRQHFPAFREMELGMEKWWALEIAAMGQQQSFEYMSPEETERWLTDALTIRIEQSKIQASTTAEKKKGLFSRFRKEGDREDMPVAVPVGAGGFSGPVEDYEAYSNLPGKEEAIISSFNRLQRVKQTGFPLYRPVFVRYEAILSKISRGKTKDLDADLKEVTELRAKIADTLIRATDYLNYFEATRTPERSSAFDDYLKMRRALEESDAPKRTDRISRIMDSVEFDRLHGGTEDAE